MTWGGVTGDKGSAAGIVGVAERVREGGYRIVGMMVGWTGGMRLLGWLRSILLHVSLGKGRGGVFVEL